MQLSDSFRLWCESQAIGYRRTLGKVASGALSAFELAEHLHVQVVVPSFIPGLRWNDRQVLRVDDPQGWSAVTVVCGDVKLIVYNDQHLFSRQQADVMHELAHLILQHRPMGVERFKGNEVFFRNYDQQAEEEAFYLGACLQIPYIGLKQLFAQGISDERRIAEHFNASGQMARYRINITRVRQRYEAK